MAAEILFLNPVRVQNPNRVEKDCSEQREKWLLNLPIAVLLKTNKAPVV